MTAATTSRTLKKERTQRKILDAAIEVFAESGFDAASMGTIANQAGVKKALVQYHFETKEKLWQAAIDALWLQLDEMVVTLPRFEEGQTPAQEKEFLRESLRHIIRFARKHPAWVGIMFREASSPGPRLDWLIENHLRKNIVDSMQFVELAQKHGLLLQGSPIHLSHIISGALTYILLVAPLSQGAVGVDLTSDESLDTTVDLLMRMLSPKS